MIRIQAKSSDLGGGFFVKRVLPNRAKRMVGPFVFLDHMGPVEIQPNQNTDVRPHPHIGLSTLTYLFEGKMQHHDSLGSKNIIEPGAVNWMTAGKGISHSERAPESERNKVRRLHGLQFWIALPDELEDCEPKFEHWPANQIPELNQNAVRIRVVAGEAFGSKSPVLTSSELLFFEGRCTGDGTFNFQRPGFELGIYLISGNAKVGDSELLKNEMLVFEDGILPLVHFENNCQFVVIGGPRFESPRQIWWNLVSSSKEKIDRAKAAWKDGRFPMVPGETEFIPLPEY